MKFVVDDFVGKVVWFVIYVNIDLKLPSLEILTTYDQPTRGKIFSYFFSDKI